MTTFNEVSKTNLSRALEWHPGGLEEWSPAEWGNATAGEMGELCNVLKKILRVDSGIQQASGLTRDELRVMAAQEIGDTFLYLDLIAQRLGLNTYECVRDTFNRVSLREGFPQRLDEPRPKIDARPGHYITMGRNDNADDMVDALRPGVEGLQVRYRWAELEPAFDQYYFVALGRDLDLMAQHGKRLVVFIEDKSFDGVLPTPGYLMDYTPANRNRGFTSIRWHPYVRERFQRLMQLIGAAFDKHPAFEGIALQESSPSLSDEVLDAHGYTPELYRDSLIEAITVARQSCPTSQVFWYMNFLPRKQVYIEHIAREAVKLDVAMGGPDVLPESASLQMLAYPYYEEYKQQLVLFNSMQHHSYGHKRSDGTYWTLRELYEYAVDVLHVDYLFWNRKTWRDPKDSYNWTDALPVIEQTAHRTVT